MLKIFIQKIREIIKKIGYNACSKISFPKIFKKIFSVIIEGITESDMCFFNFSVFVQITDCLYKSLIGYWPSFEYKINELKCWWAHFCPYFLFLQNQSCWRIPKNYFENTLNFFVFLFPIIYYKLKIGLSQNWTDTTSKTQKSNLKTLKRSRNSWNTRKISGPGVKL